MYIRTSLLALGAFTAFGLLLSPQAGAQSGTSVGVILRVSGIGSQTVRPNQTGSDAAPVDTSSKDNGGNHGAQPVAPVKAKPGDNPGDSNDNGRGGNPGDSNNDGHGGNPGDSNNGAKPAVPATSPQSVPPPAAVAPAAPAPTTPAAAPAPTVPATTTPAPAAH